MNSPGSLLVACRVGWLSLRAEYLPNGFWMSKGRGGALLVALADQRQRCGARNAVFRHTLCGCGGAMVLLNVLKKLVFRFCQTLALTNTV